MAYITAADYARFQERDLPDDNNDPIFATFEHRLIRDGVCFYVDYEVSGDALAHEWKPLRAYLRRMQQGTWPMVDCWEAHEALISDRLAEFLHDFDEDIDADASLTWEARNEEF